MAKAKAIIYEEIAEQDVQSVECEVLETIIIDNRFEEYASKLDALGNLNLKRLRVGADRMYFRKGVNHYYVGVTTVCKKVLPPNAGLENWKIKIAEEGGSHLDISEKAKWYGTILHALICAHECRYIKTSEYKGSFRFEFNNENWHTFLLDFMRIGKIDLGLYELWKWQIKNDMFAYFKWKKEYNVEIITCEFPVFSDLFWVASCIDLVVQMDFNRKRVIAIVDLKSGTARADHPDYKLQLAIYKMLWNKDFIDSSFEVTHIFNWQPKDRQKAPNDYNLVNHTEKNFTVEQVTYFLSGVPLFWNEFYQPKGKFTFYSGGEENYSVKVMYPNQYLQLINGRRNENEIQVLSEEESNELLG